MAVSHVSHVYMNCLGDKLNHVCFIKISPITPIQSLSKVSPEPIQSNQAEIKMLMHKKYTQKS